MTTKTSFTPQEIDVFKEQFKIIDSDGDGRITSDELKSVLDREAYDHLGDAGRQKVLDSFASADTNGDKAIDFDEFLALMLQQFKEYDPQEQFRDQFKQYDKDGDGFLTAEDFKRVTEEQGGELSTQQAQDMIDMADVNGNGKVSFDEFVKIMTG